MLFSIKNSRTVWCGNYVAIPVMLQKKNISTAGLAVLLLTACMCVYVWLCVCACLWVFAHLVHMLWQLSEKYTVCLALLCLHRDETWLAKRSGIQ